MEAVAERSWLEKPYWHFVLRVCVCVSQVKHMAATTDQHSVNFLVTKERLDREAKPSYSFRLVARDGTSGNSRSSTGSVVVHVEDINDNKPTIVFPSESSTNHSVSFRENIGYTIIKVIANDKDAKRSDKRNLNGQFFYSLTPDNKEDDMFDIDPTTGEISVHRKMTEKDKGVKVMTITVVDQGQPRLQSSRRFIVVVDGSTPHLPQPGGRSPSDPAYGNESANTTDYNRIMIVVLIFFLFLLLGSVALLVYMRHWNHQNGDSSLFDMACLCCCCCDATRNFPPQSKTAHGADGSGDKIEYSEAHVDFMREEPNSTKTNPQVSLRCRANDTFVLQRDTFLSPPPPCTGKS